MTIYKVEQERLSFDKGTFQGWEEVGYFSTKEKAEKKETECKNRDEIAYGRVKVTAIEVE